MSGNDEVGFFFSERKLTSTTTMKIFIKNIGWSLFHGLHSFHDEKLSPKVKSAFHALSIHEQREWFRPTIMKYGSLKSPDQILEKIWFLGTHSDVVGGSKVSHLLCNHALHWMMIKAQECGLVFK